MSHLNQLTSPNSKRKRERNANNEAANSLGQHSTFLLAEEPKASAKYLVIRLRPPIFSYLKILGIFLPSHMGYLVLIASGYSGLYQRYGFHNLTLYLQSAETHFAFREISFACRGILIVAKRFALILLEQYLVLFRITATN